MDEDKLKELRSLELRRRELQRFSLDIIRVYNPLDNDFRFLYNGYPHTIKAKSYKDIERYKAALYFKKISQYIIGQMQINKGDELLKSRRDRGLDEILDKYQESRQIWDKVPKMNDDKLLSKIAKDVILGLVEEYGKEEPLEGSRELPKPDRSNVDEQVFNEISNKRILDPLPEKPIVAPLKRNEQNK